MNISNTKITLLTGPNGDIMDYINKVEQALRKAGVRPIWNATYSINAVRLFTKEHLIVPDDKKDAVIWELEKIGIKARAR